MIYEYIILWYMNIKYIPIKIRSLENQKKNIKYHNIVI
jgi:hypothetical protein